MSINVVLELNAKPEKINELKSTLEAILPDTRAYNGCSGISVTINQDDPLNVILIEAWESRALYETYFNWRVETGAIGALGEMLSGAPNIRYFDHLGAY